MALIYRKCAGFVLAKKPISINIYNYSGWKWQSPTELQDQERSAVSPS